MNENDIIPLLQKAYAAELETVQNYLANAAWIDGLRAHEVSEALAKDVAEELGHARQIAARLKQLGARPAGSLELERDQSYLQPSSESTDLRHVVEGVLTAERCAIALYRDLFAACDGVDPVTQDLAVRILTDEEAHCCLFEGFLKGLDAHNGADNPS